MWILSWKNYKLSKLATFVSVVGALMRYAGVICLFSSLILEGLIVFGVGIAIHFGAEAIAKNKAKKIVNNAIDANGSNNSSSQAKPQPAPNPPAPPAAEPKIKCGKCGALNPKNARFCSACGNSMIIKPIQPKKCLRCGEIVDAEKKFCSHCGYEIK